jgi:glycosyltransferase involved in cell wall biosynthesis
MGEIGNPIEKINVIVTPVSFFDGMAGSKRVRNLFEFLKNDQSYTIKNLALEKGTGNNVLTQNIIDGFTYYKITYNSRSLFNFLLNTRNIWRYLKMERQGNTKNVIYFYDLPYNFSSIMICIIGHLLHYRIIFDIVEDYQTYVGKSTLRARIRLKISIFFLKHLTWFASALVGISYPIINFLKYRYKDRIPVFHIPVNFNPKTIIPSEQNKNKTNILHFLYSGSFSPKDGIELLLEAFDKVADTHDNIELILTGKGNIRYMEDFKKVYEKCLNKTCIQYVGYLTDDEYYKRLSTCDIFIMPRTGSLYANTGFPFKLAEYLATGKPVIVTKVGDITRYLTDLDCMLIAPGSVEEMAGAMERLLNDDIDWSVMGNNGRKIAYKYFNSQNLSIQLKEIIKNEI